MQWREHLISYQHIFKGMRKEPTNFLSGGMGWDFWTPNIFFKINKEDIRNEINIYIY